MDIKILNHEVYGLGFAMHAMRNPLNSWHIGDTEVNGNTTIIGKNDIGLANRLFLAGTEHRKYMRQIFVNVDIVAPMYWCAELDTYKIGTTRNSCSFQHKGTSKPFEMSDFYFDETTDQNIIKSRQDIIKHLNYLRDKFLETKDYNYFRMIRQILPSSYMYRFSWSATYETLSNIYKQRKNHKLKEWHTFCDWIISLPYMKDFSKAR